jgi:hypothetical protein
MVLRDNRVARATSVTPPRPIARASVAAQIRRPRSSNDRRNPENFRLTFASMLRFRME